MIARFAVNTLEALSSILIVVFVLLCIVLGFHYGQLSGTGGLWAIIGGVVGWIVSSMTFGIMLALIETSKNTRQISEATYKILSMLEKYEHSRSR